MNQLDTLLKKKIQIQRQRHCNYGSYIVDGNNAAKTEHNNTLKKPRKYK